MSRILSASGEDLREAPEVENIQCSGILKAAADVFYIERGSPAPQSRRVQVL